MTTYAPTGIWPLLLPVCCHFNNWSSHIRSVSYHLTQPSAHSSLLTNTFCCYMLGVDAYWRWLRLTFCQCSGQRRAIDEITQRVWNISSCVWEICWAHRLRLGLSSDLPIDFCDTFSSKDSCCIRNTWPAHLTLLLLTWLLHKHPCIYPYLPVTYDSPISLFDRYAKDSP